MKKKKGLGKLLAGVALGTGLGVLFAPKKGSETRAQLKEKLDEMIARLKDVDAEDVKETIETKIYEIKEELADLDKEKVLKIAKEKGNDLKNKADELVELAKEKGTPVIEASADAVRQKAISATKSVLAKLEEK